MADATVAVPHLPERMQRVLRHVLGHTHIAGERPGERDQCLTLLAGEGVERGVRSGAAVCLSDPMLRDRSRHGHAR
jgi:hypothetical protein